MKRKKKFHQSAGVLNRRDVKYLKPLKFRDYVTITELSDITGKDVSWLRKLERQGRIPKATRHTKGQLKIRLWSPEQVKEVVEILSHHRVGRPSNG